MFDYYNDIESLPEPIKTFTIMKILYQIPTHLREILGVSKVALSYVVQDNPTSPVPLTPLQPNPIWSLENSSIMDELFAYMPHTVPSYEADNAQVYTLLDKSPAGTNAMNSIKRHQ